MQCCLVKQLIIHQYQIPVIISNHFLPFTASTPHAPVMHSDQIGLVITPSACVPAAHKSRDVLACGRLTARLIVTFGTFGLIIHTRYRLYVCRKLFALSIIGNLSDPHAVK